MKELVLTLIFDQSEINLSGFVFQEKGLENLPVNITMLSDELAYKRFLTSQLYYVCIPG
jgi:hypothetical protein